MKNSKIQMMRKKFLPDFLNTKKKFSFKYPNRNIWKKNKKMSK